MKSTLFEQRHFVWLAAFAARQLDDDQIKALTDALKETNDRFNEQKFFKAVDKLSPDKTKRYVATMKVRKDGPWLGKFDSLYATSIDEAKQLFLNNKREYFEVKDLDIKLADDT